jgi:phosphate/sulfate permease
MSAGVYSGIKYFVVNNVHGVWRSIQLLPFVVFLTFIESFFVYQRELDPRSHGQLRRHCGWQRVYRPGAMPAIHLATDSLVYQKSQKRCLHCKMANAIAKIEYTLRHVQVFTSICTSFAHGANDVSNAVGPAAAIWYIYQNNAVASKIKLRCGFSHLVAVASSSD